MKAIGLIPSRLNSTRLPSKALLPLDGLPLVVHTYKRASLAKSLADVFVCTDSEQIADAVRSHGGKVIMTRTDHTNGTERIAEAARNRGIKADFIVDIQGDEPLINPDHIDAVVAEHALHADWDVLVPSMPITQPESTHIVKIVHDINRRVLFMSRSIIPQPFRHRPEYYLKHLSIISMRPVALQRFASLGPSCLEITESIELLRAIENEMIVGTMLLDGNSFSVDLNEDYTRAKAAMSQDAIRKRY